MFNTTTTRGFNDFQVLDIGHPQPDCEQFIISLLIGSRTLIPVIFNTTKCKRFRDLYRACGFDKQPEGADMIGKTGRVWIEDPFAPAVLTKFKQSLSTFDRLAGVA